MKEIFCVDLADVIFTVNIRQQCSLKKSNVAIEINKFTELRHFKYINTTANYASIQLELLNISF